MSGGNGGGEGGGFLGGLGITPGDEGTGQEGTPGMGPHGGGVVEPPSDTSLYRDDLVTTTESDLEALGSFETAQIPQHLVDKGLITPFAFQMPELSIYSDTNKWGTKDAGFRDAEYLSPSQFKEATQYDYSSYPGSTNPAAKAVTNWIAEAQAQRQEQYAKWKTDFGHFLGGAGTRLASRFTPEKAKLNKQTLLAGNK